MNRTSVRYAFAFVPPVHHQMNNHHPQVSFFQEVHPTVLHTSEGNSQTEEKIIAIMNRTNILDINYIAQKMTEKEIPTSDSCYLGSLSHPWGLFSPSRSQRHHDIDPS